MTFDVSSWLSLNPGEALVLQFFLPFVVAFLISLLIYVLINRGTWQSTTFSPTTASILTAPILGVAYHTFITRGDFIHNTFENIVLGLGISLIFFAPVFFILLPLLAIYLRRAFRRRAAPSGILFSAAAVACLVLQAAWLFFWLNHPS